MRKVSYNLSKLANVCNIDVKSALKNFDTSEEYFLKLDEFIKDSKSYLSAYSSYTLLIDANNRRAFRDDIKKISAVLTSLGISAPLKTLSEVDYMDHQDAFTRWLQKFRSEIDKTVKDLISSQVSEDDNPQNKDRLNKPCVLAVDDKPELLTTLVNMLNDRFKVMAVTSGNAALKLIEKHAPELFLLDIEMPQMNGYELAMLIRRKEKFERTPIIFLTGLNTRSSVTSAMQMGGSDYVIKPVNKDILINKMLQHLNIDK